MIPDSFSEAAVAEKTRLTDGSIRKCLPSEGLETLPQNARVLVIRLRSMGDVILMTPALRMLHEWRPDLQVSVLLDPAWIALLSANPAVKSTIPLENKLTTLRTIRGENFDAVINLHGGPTSALLTRLSGAPRRIGLAHFRSRKAYNVTVPRIQDILPESSPRHRVFHTAEHIASVFFWLGVPVRTIPSATLFPSERFRESVAGHLASLGFESNERYAVIHATALYASKRWFPGGFADAVRHVESLYGIRSILLGGKGDENVLKEVEKQAGQALPLAVDWPISEMMALIGRARLFVGNDSGPAHVAAALGIPVAVIFGSSNSALWGPWRAASCAVIQNHFDCNPCAGDRCYAYAEPRCILSITTAQVCAAIDRLMAETRETNG